MKKILAAIIAMLLFNCFSFADNDKDDGKKWYFGIKTGANYPTENYTMIDASIPFTGGLNAGYNLNDIFSLQAELNYFAIASGYETCHFIQIPLLVKILCPIFGHGDKTITPYFDFGPELDWQVANSIDYDRFIRIGLNVGIGIEHAFSNGIKISFEIRHEWVSITHNIYYFGLVRTAEVRVIDFVPLVNIFDALIGYTF